jgi:uncharacterized protein
MNPSVPNGETESPLQFPTDFPIKVMGKTQDLFAQTVLEIVLRHAPDYDPRTMEMRSSRNAKYLSLTVTIHAKSREQLDDLYRELSGHEMVVMVL